MRRRTALQAGVGAICSAFVAGCTGGGSNGTTPPLFDVDPSTLLPSADLINEELPQEWEQVNTAQRDDNRVTEDAEAYREFWRVRNGEKAPFWGEVIVGTSVFEDPTAAQAALEDHPYYEGWGLDPVEIATTALAGEIENHPDRFGAFFRDANALGALLFEQDDSEPEVVIDLAEAVHGTWREG